MKTFYIEYVYKFKKMFEIIKSTTSTRAVRVLQSRHNRPIQIKLIKLYK